MAHRPQIRLASVLAANWEQARGQKMGAVLESPAPVAARRLNRFLANNSADVRNNAGVYLVPQVGNKVE
jgi:hypothetical protein